MKPSRRAHAFPQGQTGCYSTVPLTRSGVNPDIPHPGGHPDKQVGANPFRMKTPRTQRKPPRVFSPAVVTSTAEKKTSSTTLKPPLVDSANACHSPSVQKNVRVAFDHNAEDCLSSSSSYRHPHFTDAHRLLQGSGSRTSQRHVPVSTSSGSVGEASEIGCCEKHCLHSRSAIIMHLEWRRELAQSRKIVAECQAALRDSQDHVQFLLAEKRELSALYSQRVAEMQDGFARELEALRESAESNRTGTGEIKPVIDQTNCTEKDELSNALQLSPVLDRGAHDTQTLATLVQQRALYLDKIKKLIEENRRLANRLEVSEAERTEFANRLRTAEQEKFTRREGTATFSSWKDKALAAVEHMSDNLSRDPDEKPSDAMSRAMRENISRCTSALRLWKKDKAERSADNASSSDCRRCGELVRALLDKEKQLAEIAAERNRYRRACERLSLAEKIHSSSSSST